jgi:hypothetical protein
VMLRWPSRSYWALGGPTGVRFCLRPPAAPPAATRERRSSIRAGAVNTSALCRFRSTAPAADFGYSMWSSTLDRRPPCLLRRQPVPCHHRLLQRGAIGSIGGLDQGQMVKDDRAFNVKVAIVGDAGMRLAEQPL